MKNKYFLDGFNLLKPRDGFGKWLNVQPFLQEGLNFMKYGYYTSEPPDSPTWINYWKEQLKRCTYGYELNGTKITGPHYFYLNFCPIKKASSTDSKVSHKIAGFPDFWDGDYNYFWIREIARKGVLHSYYNDNSINSLAILTKAENNPIFLEQETKRILDLLNLNVRIHPEDLYGGLNLIIGKSRRKGYSFKSASIAANNYFTKPNTLTIFAAYDKKYLYPNGVFSMAMSIIHFINDNTAWSKAADAIKKYSAGHVRASYMANNKGLMVERGFMSEIQAISFKDNPDGARGKDVYDMFFEESGAFGTPGLLKDSYNASVDCAMAGSIKTGMLTLYGTSGSLESGTADYADMFNRPAAFNLMRFYNIWDDKCGDQICGFFHPYNWNSEGYYDANGNSDFDAAKTYELNERKKLIDNLATSFEIQKRIQEKPLGPNEAFQNANIGMLALPEVARQLQKVRSNKLQDIKATPVELYWESGEVKPNILLREKAKPITSLFSLPNNLSGCLMIYEFPVTNPPKGLYKIGYDPVRQDLGSSLAAIVVYKGVHTNSFNHSTIVAEYVGRPQIIEDIDRLAEKLAVYYNTTIMHENEVVGVKNFFRRENKLHLLAVQPDAVISKNVNHSKVARVYGCHMVAALKEAGIRYIKEWLLTVIDKDEHDRPIMVVDKIYSIRLLEELMAFDLKGNFDLVSALIMCMFQVQEERLGKVYSETADQSSIEYKLSELMERMCKSQSTHRRSMYTI